MSARSAWSFLRGSLRTHWAGRFLAIALALNFLAAGFCNTLHAEDKKPARKPGATEEDEVPPPEEISLTTGDGMQIAMTYFPGLKGKESIPVVLLHALKGSRKDFLQEQGLAVYLREKLGCAVLVPDLRGHGESATIKVGRRVETLKPEKLTPAQFGNMVTEDLLEVKKFLWKKNNAGELNIDKLCVVGAEMGASIALNFAAYDGVGYEQNVPDARYGPLKLGNFVKLLVLVSPEMNLRGMNLRDALSVPRIREKIPVMVLVGKGNATRLTDAERFVTLFSRNRIVPKDDKDETAQTLWVGRLETSLQDVKLINETSLSVGPRIGKFIYTFLVKGPEAKRCEWKERKLPHEG